MRVCGGLCQLGASGREAHTVVEVDDSRGDQRGDLTERVTRERDDVVETWPRGFPRHERRAQHCELRVSRAGELLCRRVEQEWRERLAQCRLGLLDDLPRGVVLPRHTHAGLLRSLAGEHDGDAQDRPPAEWVGARKVKGLGPRPGRQGYTVPCPTRTCCMNTRFPTER